MSRSSGRTGHDSTVYTLIDEAHGATGRESRARKRAEIGLTPDRPTARTEFQRPPVGEEPVDGVWRWMAWLLGGVLLVTAMLVLAGIGNAPTAWPYVRAQADAWLRGEMPGAATTYDPALTAPYRRLLALDFGVGAAGLAEEELPNQHHLFADREQGSYHMRVWPGNLAWSVLGKVCLGPFRVESSARVAATAPAGYAGLLGRFQNARNFYLFALNGNGEYRVMLLLDGEWRTVQPWTSSPAINWAGGDNVLALTDDGRALSFFSNDSLLYTLDALALPAGNTGLAAGAVDHVADITYDWLHLYDLPCRVP